MKMSQAFNYIWEGLQTAGIESPVAEGELWLRERFGLDRSSLYLKFDEEVTLRRDAIEQFISVRARGYPFGYLLGRVGFLSFEFKVDGRAMIPRQETELLVEAILKRGQTLTINNSPLMIVDLGTGCGNIAISLAKSIPLCKVYATDISEDAIALARENARRNGVEEGRILFLEGDLFSPLKPLGFEGKVDIVVSNPPYVPSSLIKELQPEVGFEPSLSLDGGRDGLSFYRRIIPEVPGYLRAGGYLFLEVGFKQSSEVVDLISHSTDLSVTEIIKDYSGIERVVCARME